MSLRRRSRKSLKKQDEEESDQDFQHSYDPNSELHRYEEPRQRITRNNKANYAEQEKKDAQHDEQQIEDAVYQQEFYDFLTPRVEFILWKTDGEEESFLVKFLGRSYIQTKWMTRDSLSELGFEVNSSCLKSIKIKMRKTRELKLKPDTYFNPNYLIADRILTSTQMFTAIHHKRANDIKGKWDESIMLVCQKILNFVKDSYPYGVILHQPYNQQIEKEKGITHRINIGQVLNKIYLAVYQSQKQFWIELGRAIKNYLIVYPEDKGDYHKVGLTIKECSIFLYQQWYRLCKQRYIELCKQLASKGVIPQKIINEKEDIGNQQALQPPILIQEQKGETNTIDQPARRINIKEQFCKTNIFLTEKSVDTPRNQQQLQLLNPMQFSYAWLDQLDSDGRQYLGYLYIYLTEQDFKNLDLNIEVDKLYYVKWKDLSYKDATWQSQKNINSIQKIQEFKQINKIPVRQIRDKVEIHNKIHKFLMEYYEIMSDKKGQNPSPNIQKMETKLYLLDATELGKPKQYLGKDIPIYKNYRKLKDFQLESLNWLIKSWYENRNTILADEMGLGKTIQTIAFLFHLHAHENVLGPFLILAPLTTLQQWRRQIEEWTTFNCLLYYDQGTSDVREIIQEYQFYHMHTTKSGDIIPSKIPKFQILLTNYELFINDFQILKKIPYQHMVLDEAHRLKNKNAKTTTILNKLPCCRKTLLTGTPIQNNTKQLWTLLNFIQPKTFASQQAFLQEYGSLSTEEQVKNFKKMLKPYILRRVKEDVQTTIPKLSQTIIDVEMSSKQKTYYRGILQKNKTAMIKSLTAANFNSITTQLRKCCNHPYLISPETEAEIKFGAINDWEQMDKFIKSSGKMILLMKLLEKFKAEGKKVLIFSQFVVMLDLMKPYLQMSGYNCQILKGSQSSTSRHQAITRFNHQETDVFLISTKAGGVGINLVAATQIVIYDSDWNPQNDIQATARAHRIGQKKEVTVYRLITANSYESQMFQMSSKKLGLDKAIFTGDTFKSMGQFDDTQKQLTKTEIQLLLKKGIVGFLESNVDQDQFFNQTIQDILAKNARKVQYSVTQNSCTFSKTKFKSEETNDININAPDFWEQALKGIQSPVDKLVKKRKQLKEYSTKEKQQELMIETYRIVFHFVKQKTLGAGFNAQDERNIVKFLETITSERTFSRHLREIADQLSNQISKPSRRFKVKQEDIILNNINNSFEQPHREIADKRESSRIKRLKKKDENFCIDGIGQVSEDEISDVSEEKQQQSPTPQQEQKPIAQEDNIYEEFQKLCYLCQKPKCSTFCKSVCGRSFHRKCLENFNKGLDSKPQSFELDEFGMEFEKWKDQLSYDQKCITCKQKNYVFKCSICMEQGNYFQEQSSSKKKKNKSKKEEKQRDQYTLYKCSAAGKCHKFYHLQCLFTLQYQGKFSDQTGKTIKDISNVTKTFRCPAHYCFSCYGVDSKSTKLKSYSCIRCCRGFHDKCLDKDTFIRLGTDHYYICLDHLENIEAADVLTSQIQKFKPNKKEKLSQKKKTKQSKKHKEKQIQTGHQQMQEYKIQQPIKQPKQPKTKKQDAGLRRSKRINREQSEPEKMEVQKQIINGNGSLTEQSYKKQIKQQEALKSNEKAKEQEDKQLNSSKAKSKKSKKSKSKSKSKEEPRQSRSKEKKGNNLRREVQNLSNNQRSKTQKSKTEISAIFAAFKYQYSDFNLTPIDQFNYAEYKHSWCRFCGSRYAKNFELGPWGTNKLCSHHYEQFKKGRLKLDKYKNQPKVPINKNKQNQLRYLNEYVKSCKISPEEAIVKLNAELNII